MTFLQNRLKYLSVSTCVLADYSSSWGIFIAFKSSFSDLSEVIASDNVISHCPVILWSAVKRRRIKKYFYFTARCWFFSHLLMSKVKKMTCFLFSFLFLLLQTRSLTDHPSPTQTFDCTEEAKTKVVDDDVSVVKK